MDLNNLIIKKIRDRSQLVIGLLLFFPVTIGALFEIGPDKLSGNVSILSWGSVIGIFILDYLYFELLGHKINEWIKKTFNVFLLIEVASFAVVVLALSLLPKGGSGVTVLLYKYAYIVGLGCLTFIPLIVLVLFTLHFVYLIAAGRLKG